MRLVAPAGALALGLAGYFAGAAVGAAYATARVDFEWARFLENEMVGPGSTTRPGTAAAAASLTLNGGT